MNIDDPKTALRLFREFVIKNATQWKIGANHHHPIWTMVAEVLESDNNKKLTEEEYKFIYCE